MGFGALPQGRSQGRQSPHFPLSRGKGAGDRDFKIVVYLINELFCNLTHSFLNKKIHKKVLQISYKGAIILKHLKSAEGISMPFGIYCQRV